MKALDENLIIAHGARDESGTKLDPEEQPVDRVISTMLPVTVGNAPGQGTKIDLPVRGSIVDQTTALEVAAEMSRMCMNCSCWDPQAWREDMVRFASTAEGRAWLDQQRKQALEVADVAELTDLLRARGDVLLLQNGKCHAVSAAVREDIYTHPRATCPTEAPDGTPFPDFFRPRGRAGQKAVDQIRDRILHAAAGRKS